MSDDIEQLIEDCEHRESRMSDWEREFIDSINKQLRDGRTLSEKQVGVLNKIWDKVTEKG